ncbi:MAG: hypothetical protein UR60_C0006G0036 [Candidatus Moranbacteria bacterium GW2011_GWF2_34_56]|nr:MAG: hypothetical protein UR51_C0005G0040 [Candidatus Moranbacteria bacterium GW2011_GWF1_34_10]KKP65214.1 MAG: hypothetical protein UR60_C0006G0036 [Candidatus Moranbacteria bacterium GW2011_GWF2_34_56]HBI17666.1 hypothetical protein [Candidatus Moranbacteria bacterium]
MKKITYITIVILVAVLGIAFLLWWLNLKNSPEKPSSSYEHSDLNSALLSPETNLENENKNDEEAKEDFQMPLDRASERITKKPFGKFVTPKNSPVSPEKFYGYHTAVDFEIFPEEESVEVSIRTVCSGKLLEKRLATGYGGVAVQFCELDESPITVVYGHLNLSSIKIAKGDNVNVGETLGILGKGYSDETSGERKHLHLGFHKGAGINILGYVPKESDLSNWLDPMLFLK